MTHTARATRRPFRARKLTAAAAFAAAIAIATTANAQSGSPPPEARERFERGIDLYRQGDYGGALGEFRRAYELSPYAVVLFNLGQTYAALGRPVEAADAMKDVIANPGTLSADRLARAKEVFDEQSARIASVTIQCDVAGAVVEVDGVERGKTPLSGPLRVKAGPHRIALIKSGFAPSRHEVDAPSGKTTALDVKLEPTDVRLGHLTVHTKLPGAEVRIDGEAVGVTPLPSEITVLPGSHQVELAREGYRSAKTSLTIGDGADADVTLEPDPDPVAIESLGSGLVLDVSEDQTIVTVDGTVRASAGKRIRLAPGPHAIRIERDGFNTIDRTIVLERGKTEQITIELEPTPETLANYVGEAETYRILGWIGVVGGTLVTGGGIVFLVVNQGEKDDAEAAIGERNLEFEPGGKCDPSSEIAPENAELCSDSLGMEQQETYDSAKTRDIIGYVGIGVGAAVVVTGVVLWMVGDDPDRYDRDVDEELVSDLRPVVEVGESRGFVGIRGAF